MDPEDDLQEVVVAKQEGEDFICKGTVCVSI
jgi:hypothetical protein